MRYAGLVLTDVVSV